MKYDGSFIFNKDRFVNKINKIIILMGCGASQSSSQGPS